MTLLWICPRCSLRVPMERYEFPIHCRCGLVADWRPDMPTWKERVLRTTNEIKLIEQEHCEACDWFLGYCHATTRANCANSRRCWKMMLRNPLLVCPDGKWGKNGQ